MAEAARVPKTTIPGTYAVRFNGYDREDTQKRARFLVGVGQITLTAKTATTGDVDGGHFSTNSPMTGSKQSTPGVRLAHSEYYIKGTYEIEDDGTQGKPILLELTLRFVEATGESTKKKMTDVFKVMQCGPNQFWLISTKPSNTTGANPEDVDELSMGEATKVTDDW
jgi:hypothetical protein